VDYCGKQFGCPKHKACTDSVGSCSENAMSLSGGLCLTSLSLPSSNSAQCYSYFLDKSNLSYGGSQTFAKLKNVMYYSWFSSLTSAWYGTSAWFSASAWCNTTAWHGTSPCSGTSAWHGTVDVEDPVWLLA